MKLQTTVRTSLPAATISSCSAALGIALLIIAFHSPASADSPIRIKSTRTTPAPTRNLSTTRLRVSTTAAPTRITAIKEVPIRTSPSYVKTATLQDTPATSQPTEQTENSDDFLPLREIDTKKDTLQQPVSQPPVTVKSDDDTNVLLIESPATPDTAKQAIPPQDENDTFQPLTPEPVPLKAEPKPVAPPVLLIGQDTSDGPASDDPDGVETTEQQEDEPTPDAPQNGVLDPLEGLGGAAIRIAPSVNPQDCGSPDCEKASELVRSKPISKISLDISPSFKPGDLEGNNTKLQPETREWRDRNGKILAEGQLADYVYSSVHIKQKNGELTSLPISSLSVDDICYIANAWGFPKQCRIDNSPFEQRAWEKLNFHWRASAVAHKPIYFEDAQLERHGHTLGPWLQPMRSGAHFFTNIAILPYHMGIHPWNECQYALGYHRPGSVAPRVKPAFPISKRAALIQAGSVLGGVFIIP